MEIALQGRDHRWSSELRGRVRGNERERERERDVPEVIPSPCDGLRYDKPFWDKQNNSNWSEGGLQETDPISMRCYGTSSHSSAFLSLSLSLSLRRTLFSCLSLETLQRRRCVQNLPFNGTAVTPVPELGRNKQLQEWKTMPSSKRDPRGR